MPTPKYTQTLLNSLTFETRDIEDHGRLIQLYQDLHDQGDIDFNEFLRNLISAPPHFFRFVKAIETIPDLCEFQLQLIALQEKGFAVVTGILNRRIAFQRELILERNKNKH
jgi:hypothetical protein